MSLNYTSGDGERETLKVAEDRLDLQGHLSLWAAATVQQLYL